jgi:hypothetical protein
VSVDPNNPRLRITTTTQTHRTTTTRPTTTTTPTTLPGTPITVVPGQTPQTIPSGPTQTTPTNPGTAGPQCPDGSVSTNLAPNVTSVGASHTYHVVVDGETVNNTKGRIAIVVTVPVTYYANNVASTVNLTVPSGLTAPPNGSKTWAVSTDVVAQSQPSVGQPKPGYYFVEAIYSGCHI